MLRARWKALKPLEKKRKTSENSEAPRFYDRYPNQYDKNKRTIYFTRCNFLRIVHKVYPVRPRVSREIYIYSQIMAAIRYWASQ